MARDTCRLVWSLGTWIALGCVAVIPRGSPASEPEVDVGGAPMALQCNGCSSATIIDKATAAGHGDRYYYDLVTNVMHHVVTECEPAGGGGTVCNAYEDTVPAAIASKFADYRGLWLQNASSETFNQQIAVNIPSGGPVGPDQKPIDDGYINAFDTVGFVAFDDLVVARINDPTHYAGFYAVLLMLVEPLSIPIISFDKLTLVVVVTFNDHSKRTYKFDKGLHSFAAVPGTARDANGNDVPESKPPPGRNYIFNRDPLQNRYDERNVTQILPVTPPGLPQAGCIQEKWDGQRLTCILPRP